MLGTEINPYDIIICGAGPAGLTAGIVAGRYKLKTLILEKENQPSPFPRGETLHAARIFTEILGSNILNMLSNHLTAARKFNSPFAKNSFEIYRESPSIVYEWDRFIGLLKSRLAETGVELRCNSEVSYPIMEKKVCIGVQLANGEKIYATSVIDCEGHASNIGRVMGVPYEIINCPIAKRVISNFKSDYQGFEYFFIASGMLEYAPRFPPAIIFVFPRGNEKCEVGFMIFQPEALQLRDYCDIPDETELLRVWHNLIETYPRFSEIMKDTVTEFEGVSNIATGGLHEKFVPHPGLILVGGAIGYVEASGASGIASSMRMAKFAVDYIYTKQIKSWNIYNTKKIMIKYRRSKDFKHIKKTQKIFRIGLNWLFVKLRTADEINKKWNFIKSVYKIA